MEISRRSVLATAAGLAAGATVGVGRATAAPRVPASHERVTAITHATVIDATGAPPRPDTTVLVGDGRTVDVGPSRRLGVPPWATRVDGRDDPRYRYCPAEVREFWQFTLNLIYLDGRTPEQDARGREIFERRLQLVADLDRAGVGLLAGTDYGTTYLMAGFSLHDELAQLSAAGLPAMRVLQAATVEPARHLGRHDQGTIERGKVADLVLLDADPLRDIRNTTRIDAVFTRGRLLDRATRERMLDDVLAAAGEPATAPTRARCC